MADAPGVADPRPLWIRLLRTVVPMLLAIAAGAIVLVFVVREVAPHSWSGTAFADPDPAPDFTGLSFDSGEPADLDRYEGKVVVVYFGYTSCPDVCPLTLSRAARAIDGLGDRGDDVQLFMISVDPARDTLERLGEYLRFFDERFIGVGGDVAAVADVAASYGVFFEPQPPEDDGFYEVDHTATLLGIDRQGNLKVIWNPDVEADPLRSDLEELLG
ncbi:MAG: SCO family protein [Acidimicrobiales bacterium]